MQDKITIIFDFDDTLVNTSDAMIDYYNEKYHDKKDYKLAEGTIYRWDAQDKLPLMNIKQIMKIFESTFFWKNIRLKDDAIEVVKYFSDHPFFNVKIMSVGTAKNLSKKSLYIQKYFPFVDEVVLLMRNNAEMGKGDYTNNCIVLDDHQENLTNPKALNVIIYDLGDREFNQNFKGIKVKSLMEFKELIMDKFEKVIKEENN